MCFLKKCTFFRPHCRSILRFASRDTHVFGHLTIGNVKFPSPILFPLKILSKQTTQLFNNHWYGVVKVIDILKRFCAKIIIRRSILTRNYFFDHITIYRRIDYSAALSNSKFGLKSPQLFVKIGSRCRTTKSEIFEQFHKAASETGLQS